MPVSFIPPTMPEVYRVLLLGSATARWYQASDEDREHRILPRFAAMIQAWLEMGARPLASLDDDLFSVGEQNRPGWFLMFELDRLETVVGMLQAVRETVDDVRMDEYVRFDARVGRPFFLLEAAG